MESRNGSVTNSTNSNFDRKLVVKLFDKFPLLTVATTAKSNNETEAQTSAEKH